MDVPLDHAAAAPDWSATGSDVHCPMCEYNLRGLSEPRCPECGYRFDWRELLDPSRRRHPFLFEHHPNRNIWSFGRTAVATLFFPRSFWKSLHASQPSNPKRLVWFWLLTTLPVVALGIGVLSEQLVLAMSWYGGIQRWSRMQVRSQLRIVATDDLHSGGYGTLSLVLVVWPMLTIAGLLVFQWSMRKARVRFVHVLRCVVYSCDMGLIAWLIPTLGLLVATVGITRWGTRFDPFRGAAAWGTGVLVLMMIYRLMLAYRWYMRFDRAPATVACSQIMVALAVWKLLMMAQGY